MDDVPSGELKNEYIAKINELMTKCNEIDVLDFILQMLQKILLMKLQE